MRDTDLTPDETLALAELLAAYKANMVRFSEVCAHVEDLIATRVTPPDEGTS